MALRRMLSDVSRSRKSKMAAAKPEMRVFQFVYLIESKKVQNVIEGTLCSTLAWYQIRFSLIAEMRIS